MGLVGNPSVHNKIYKNADMETWEPMLEALIPSVSNVRTIYSLEWPTHGESALANAAALRSRKYRFGTHRLFHVNALTHFTSGADDWAALIAKFVRRQGFDPRTTIAIGHSAGCAALLVFWFSIFRG